MLTQGRKTVIGGFVVGAAALLIGGVIFFGGGAFFSEVRTGVLFFDEPVTGLSAGAPVQFMGVKVGEVTTIQLLVKKDSLEFLSKVVFNFHPGAIVLTDEQGCALLEAARADSEARDNAAERNKRLIERGLRAQLVLQSMVTGQLMVSLNFFPGTPVRLRGLAADIPELPTTPSSREKLSRTLENLPIAAIMKDLQHTIEGLDRLVNADDSKETMTNLRTSTEKLAQVLDKLNEAVEPLAAGSNELLREAGELVKRLDGRVPALVDDLEGALGDARKVMGKIDGQVEPLALEFRAAAESATRALTETAALLRAVSRLEPGGSPLAFEIGNVLRSFDGAMDAVKALGVYLQEHPEALLRGKAGN